MKRLYLQVKIIATHQAGDRVLKLKDIHPHWRLVKSLRQPIEQGRDEKKNHTNEGDNGEASSPPPSFDLLRIQESTIVKSEGRSPGALNKMWAGASQRPTASQRRQQAFEESTHRESSGFEYAQTRIPDSQSPSATYIQRAGRGGRRQGSREGGHRGERGDARGRAMGGQNAGVPTSYMGNFQM